MRFILPAALMLATVAAALADGNPTFDRDTICASIYQPVCASKAGESRTFPNACLAVGAGFAPIGQGACGEASVLPRFRTKVFAPVCPRRGPNVRTFPNRCEAEGAGYRMVSDGPC